MSDVTQPRKARGKVLPVAIVASALFALLALAPFASAAPDPVASGSTTLTLQKSFVKYLGTFGIKVAGTGKAKVKGATVTFPVSGGSVDPTTGKGTLKHNGGLKLTAGKTNVKIGALEVNTKKKMLSGKAGGKKLQLASLGGLKVTRNGFGANLVAKKVKLTAGAANALNKALGFAGGKPLPFLKNKLIASSKSVEQPKETALVPGGSMTFALNAELARKLSAVEAKVVPLTGTTVLSPNPPVFSFPITGGTFAPSGNAGTVQSGGGLSLVQSLTVPTTPAPTVLNTNITLGGFWYDLQAKTITVEVSATSTASKELNLGALGRSSVANVTIGGVIADPKTRSVAVQNSSAVLQPLSGEVLNGFVKVFAEATKGKTELEAKKLGEEAAKLGAEAEADKKEAEKLAGESVGKPEPEKKEKEEAAAKKGKEAEVKGGEAQTKKKEAEAKLASAAPAAAKVLADNAIAGGQPLGLISFSGQAQ